MEREIKFRAWDGEKMIFPSSIDRLGIAHWTENSVFESSDEVMQFIGLKDKNGKEIYEGDIVLANGNETNLKHDFSSARKYVSASIKDTYEVVKTRSEYEVYWDNDFSMFDFKTLKNSHINPSIMERELEIIGNIHENPELLK